MSTGTPLDGVDLLLADLDGVIYTGENAIPYAVESMNSAARSIRVAYITNNASRTAASVAAHLTGLGLTVAPEEVVTSPQAAVRVLAGVVPPGARILVVGGEGLTDEVTKAGFTVTDSATDDPAAVIQGFHPSVGWTQLAEASFALHSGIPWVATNTDWTIPVDRGIAPGNGTLVSAVHSAVGRLPLVAGKPETPLFTTAVERFAASRPLFVGDRLDTDIAGANAAGMPSALVLTGIDGPKEVLSAPEKSRPQYLLADLRGLQQPYPEPRQRGSGIQVGRAIARIDGVELQVVRPGEPIDLLRAAALTVWSSGVSAYALRIPDAVLGLRAALR